MTTTGMPPFALCCCALAFSLPLTAVRAGSAEVAPPGEAARLIAHFAMQRIPQEGAWFSPSYASTDEIAGGALPPRYAGRAHAAGSAIFAVATRRDFSALHRLQSDEVWHFYGGAPLDMLLLYPDGGGRRVRLGPRIAAGEIPQFTVPHGVWVGAAPHGSARAAYSFFGTQLAPAFDYADFAIGYRDALTQRYPAFALDIARLTRTEFARSPATNAAEGDVRTAAEPAAEIARDAAAAPAAAGRVIEARDLPAVPVSAGVELRELVGRVAREARSSTLSVAEFVLSPGRSTASSYNRKGEEVLLVTAGTGTVRINGVAAAVHAGSTVFVPPEVRHDIAADADQTLVFYAITAPAFTPDDYVSVAP
jgi:predicted cupin superfamily sugar epimerase/quercetin dioxygenase-like cupin family protein